MVVRTEEFELKFQQLANRLDGRLKGRLSMSTEGLYLVRRRMDPDWAMTAYFSGNENGNDVEFAILPSRIADKPYSESQVQAWLDAQNIELGGRVAKPRNGVQCWNRGFTLAAGLKLLDQFLEQYKPLVERRWILSAGAGESAPAVAVPVADGAPRNVMVAIKWPPVTDNDVDWSAGTEAFPLSLHLLHVGELVDTVESYPDWAPIGYTAKCVGYVHADGRHVVTLEYTGEDNQEVAHTDIRWGTTRLTFSDDLSDASAVYSPIGGNPVHSTKCEVSETNLFQGLSRAQVTVLLRPQQARLRAKLLDMPAPHKLCAISEEPLPEALELAHIIAHADRGVCTLQNAILLRADLHAMFDAGKLRIDPEDGSVSLHKVPAESGYHAACKGKALPAAVFRYVQKALRARHDARQKSDAPDEPVVARA